MSENRPKVGIGVWIEHEGKFLLFQRKSDLGKGTWTIPGGSLEFGETLEECAKREIMEECGISLKNVKQLTATNDVFEDLGKHYVSIHMHGTCDKPDFEVKEPEKHENFKWMIWDELPENLFLPVKSFVKNNKKPENITCSQI